MGLLGDERERVARVPVICAGPVTAAAAREAGFLDVVVSADPGASAMVEAVAELWQRTRGLAKRERVEGVMTAEVATKGSGE
jgi:hypothetical protein